MRGIGRVVVMAAAGGMLWMLMGAAAPATQPAASLDLSSPKSTVISVYGALKAGDVDAAKQCLVFSDAAQAESFDITVTELWRPLAVMRAMEARFGEGAKKLFSTESLEKTADEAIREMNQAQVTVNGDRAVVEEKKAAADPAAENVVTGITLKKENEQWKIVASSFPETPGEIPASQLPMMRAMKTSVESACRGILARLARGDFKTADEAYAAYQAMLQQASATRPAK